MGGWGFYLSKTTVPHVCHNARMVEIDFRNAGSLIMMTHSSNHDRPPSTHCEVSRKTSSFSLKSSQSLFPLDGCQFDHSFHCSKVCLSGNLKSSIASLRWY